MRTCPYCEAWIQDNSIKCRYCWEYVVDKSSIKVCPYCESEISNTAKKCKYCWEWVSNNETKSLNRSVNSKWLYSYSFVNNEKVVWKNNSIGIWRLQYFLLSIIVNLIVPFILYFIAYFYAIYNDIDDSFFSLLSICLSIFVCGLQRFFMFLRLDDIWISKLRLIALLFLPPSPVVLCFIPSKIKEKFWNKSEFHILMTYYKYTFSRIFILSLVIMGIWSMINVLWFWYDREIRQISEPLFKFGIIWWFLVWFILLIIWLYNKFIKHKKIKFKEIFFESIRFFIILIYIFALIIWAFTS